jgi:hypothetical protein
MKLMSKYESMTRKEQMFIFVIVLMPIAIPLETAMMWPFYLRLLLAIENMFAGFLVCYKLYKILWKIKK